MGTAGSFSHSPECEERLACRKTVANEDSPLHG
jgi:hypothetical protein